MSFSRANPLGWALYEVLTSAQMNALDIDHSNAIDGAGGGSYSPSSPLVIDNVDQLEMSATNYPSQTTRDEWRLVSLNKLDEFVAGSSWAYSAGTWVQQSASDAIYFAGDNLIDGAQLKGGRIWLTPAAGHGGLPTGVDLPILTIWKYAPGGAATLLGSATDSSVSVPAYELAHTIDVTFTPESALDESTGTHYYMRLASEGGPNFVTGLVVEGAALLWDCATNRPGG